MASMNRRAVNPKTARIIVTCDEAFHEEARLAAALARQTISTFGRESIRAAIERTRHETERRVQAAPR